MSEAGPQAPDDEPEAGEARLSLAVMVLAALGDLLFTGAAAVHVAFADASLRAAVLVGAAALGFAVATLVSLVAKRRTIVVVATVVVALAGLAAAVAAVDAGRRYDALRRQAFGDRGGVRLVEPDSAHGRRMGGAMLSSITASLAAIAAFPLAGCLALRLRGTGRTP